MRIITKHRDFYDSVQVHGGHTDLIWRRVPRQEVYPVLNTPPLPQVKSEDGSHGWPYLKNYIRNQVWRGDLGQQHIIVGFCGRIWPLVRFSQYKSEWVYTNCYTVDQIGQYLDASCGGWHGVSAKEYKKSDRRKVKTTTHAHRAMVSWFDRCEAARDRYLELFLAGGSPSFSVLFRPPSSRKPDSIIWDQTLDQFDFVRIMDPYTAFQEATMFMGNVAAPEKPIPHISDADMVSIKGFDERSFRNPHRY